MDILGKILREGASSAAKTLGKDATGALLDGVVKHYSRISSEHDLFEKALRSIAQAPCQDGPNIAMRALRRAEELR